MGKTSQFRPETLVQRIVSTIPAANTNYKVDIPAGTYYTAITITANITNGGAGAATVTARPYTNSSQTQTSNIDFRITDLDDTGPAGSLSPATGSASGRYAHILPNAAALPVITPVTIMHGLQVTVTKNGATTAEQFEVDIALTRVG